MIQITPYLSFIRTPEGAALFSTDAYGHIQARTDLTAQESIYLGGLLALAASLGSPTIVDVKAVEVTDEPVEDGEDPEEAALVATNWSEMTKTQIVDKVYADFGVELDDSDLKAVLVAAAIRLETADQAALT